VEILLLAEPVEAQKIATESLTFRERPKIQK
jgi:hypothetical protein